MIRTIFSYLVLIFVPVVSLAIAIGPYVWVKRRSARLSPMEQALLPEKEYRPANTVERASAYQVPLSRLWGAFFVGLVGNILLFIIVLNRPVSFSYYLHQNEDSAVLFSLIIYSSFLVITPFIFYKLRHDHFTGKAIVYNILISLITAGLVIGVWIVLAAVAYRGLFYQLN